MMAAAVTVDLRHCCKDHLVTDDSEESWACMARIRRFGEQMLASVSGVVRVRQRVTSSHGHRGYSRLY